MTAPAGRLAIKDIAALADVTRAAVSNWRARHEDFPSSTADSNARRPLFDFDEVIVWLESKDLLPEGAAKKQTQVQLLALANTLRGVLPPTEISPVFLYLLALRKQATTGTNSTTWQSVVAATSGDELAQILEDVPSPTGTPLVHDLHIADRIRDTFSDEHVSSLTLGIDNLRIEDYGHAAQLIIDAFLGLGGRGKDSEFGTSKSTSSTLLVNAANTTLADGDTLFDPACGIGGTLLALSREAERLTITGSDINPWAVAIAELHAYLADVPASFTRADSLAQDPHEHLQATSIVMEPPFAMRVDRSIQQDLLARAGIDVSGSFYSEDAFLLYALTHLAPGGHAYVLTPTASAYRRQSVQLRQTFVAHGVVEAVIQMPPRLLSYSVIPTVLWVLRAPESTPDTTVLIADASNATFPETQVGEWLADMRSGRDTSIPSKQLTLAELITNEGTLLPAQLLREVPDQQEVRDNLHQSVSDMIATLGSLQGMVQVREGLFESLPNSTRTASLQQLIEAGLITRLRGTYRPSKSETPDTGVPASLAHARAQHRNIEEVQVPKDSLWLEDRDILVPDLAGVPAWVFHADGSRWVVSDNVTILRITEPELDPHYLAACINASFNEAADLGTTIQRRDFRQIEIPNLDSTRQTEIADSLHRLAALQAAAETLSQQVNTAVDAAMNLVRYGGDTT
ncbi:MAG: N-6 DNA methylase [Corynebacterium sp.]|uniref:N-6 DNA methylase n=1 Tax=Corynebacterium sp. TaxID=1720 RepID=UPI0026DEF652|nr:N-6 DNA methylase [Corynebacterium sp.]MDO5669962.1 N-6 DNA methylase [Corynebacterium sp.]